MKEGALEGLARARSFDEAWATMEALGYQYGEDALEQVRLGWEVAQAAMRPREDLRDHFAGLALAGIVSTTDKPLPPERAAMFAYAYADAMLKVRAQTETCPTHSAGPEADDGPTPILGRLYRVHREGPSPRPPGYSKPIVEKGFIGVATVVDTARRLVSLAPTDHLGVRPRIDVADAVAPFDDVKEYIV